MSSMNYNLEDLTVLIFTLNEEKNINSLLKSLNWIKKIIIIDCYSIDKTVEIAKKYTNQIYFIKSKGFVESIRNFGILKVKTEWILIIDADEYLFNVSKKKIIKLINNRGIDGYWFSRRQYINDQIYLKHGYFYPDWQLRLFKKNKNYKYSGIIHQPIEIPSRRTKFTQSIIIYHNPSHSKYNSFLSLLRFFKYAKIEGHQLSLTNISNEKLIMNIVFDTLKHFYRSFIKKKGYLDGYYGFRAATNYAFYQGLNSLWALFYRYKLILL